MHLECAVPPVEQGDAREFAYRINDTTLMFFIATVDNHTATKNRTADVKSVEGTNVASDFSDCCAEPPQRAWDIVKLAIKCDREGGVRFSSHKC